jgi:ubiquinone/menaquinone biosynthesis C-methylase UbiE
MQKHWLQLYSRLLKLYFKPTINPIKVLAKNYDRIAVDYDTNWTRFMRGASDELIRNLPLHNGSLCLDLGCGTGYVMAQISRSMVGETIGVDVSQVMLDIAKKQCPDSCHFVHEDVISFLRRQPVNSFDIITCAWSFGYFSSKNLLPEIYRVLRPNGYLGIIDHSRISNKKMVGLTFKVFAENPSYLTYILRSYYPRNLRALRRTLQSSGFSIEKSWDDTITFYESSADRIVDRLLKTGGLGGLDFMMDEDNKAAFLRRYKQLLEEKCRNDYGIPIIYKTLAAVGTK